ncbi:unnamed protein product [Tilletia caries]|uniref:Uncharacterized protein n=1 Tax=Tilletia controversa TaxID=13291 RepID=A0A8X7MVH5_9BASI|nr:hypothetical protein CF336_g2581 [Tilletia laevis]KAE8249867.1 hypothetical protein A4X06_0g3027 [Tilletia controversa]CAD6891345.1 unnamed protein product [Tilletia caries]
MSMSDDRDYRRRPADFTNLAPGSALGQSTYFSSHEKEAFEAWCIEVVAGRKLIQSEGFSEAAQDTEEGFSPNIVAYSEGGDARAQLPLY